MEKNSYKSLELVNQLPDNSHPTHQPTVAIDFDGRIADVRHFPHPHGNNNDLSLEKLRPRPGTREALEAFYDAGLRIIIWTGRDDLDDIADWMDEYQLPYHYINENPDQPTDSPKIVANIYLDDRGEGSPTTPWPQLAHLTLTRLRNDLERWRRQPKHGVVQHIVITGHCLHGSTPIYDPLIGDTKTVRERYLDGKSFHVYSRDGEGEVVIAPALRPAQFEEQEMIEFRFEDGRTIVVTPGHRFWDGSGYVEASWVYERIHEVGFYPLPTILESDLPVRERDVSRWTQKAQDWRGRYSEGSCLCDEQPRWEVENDQASSPLLNDVRLHNPFSLHLGGRVSERKYILPTSADHLSKQGFLIRDDLLIEWEYRALRGSDGFFCGPYLLFLQPLAWIDHFGTGGSLPFRALYSRSEVHDATLCAFDTPEFPLEYLKLDFGLPRIGLQFASESFLPDKALVTRSDLEGFSTCDNPDRGRLPSYDCIGSSLVIQAKYVEPDCYYDFHVPVYENYWACGVFHHNSGAGKSTLSQKLSEATGMPVWKVDQDRLWKVSKPWRGTLGRYPSLDWFDGKDKSHDLEKTIQRYRKLLKKLVRRALRKSTPTILEGCHFLVCPGTLRGHKIILLDPPEHTVINQRLNRDREEGKLKEDNSNLKSREEKARFLYKKLQPAVDRMRRLQGVEVLQPHMISFWIDNIAREVTRANAGLNGKKKALKGERPEPGSRVITRKPGEMPKHGTVSTSPPYESEIGATEHPHVVVQQDITGEETVPGEYVEREEELHTSKNIPKHPKVKPGRLHLRRMKKSFPNQCPQCGLKTHMDTEGRVWCTNPPCRWGLCAFPEELANSDVDTIPRRRKDMSLDSQGGYGPINSDVIDKADFITLPIGINGTNCGNCSFNSNGICKHPKLNSQPVNQRNCCLFWDAPGTLRGGKTVKQGQKAMTFHGELGGGALAAPARLSSEPEEKALDGDGVLTKIQEVVNSFRNIEGVDLDYSRCFYHPESAQVWWESSGEEANTSEIINRLKSVEGVSEVIVESESSPPMDEGWILVWPEIKEWMVSRKVEPEYLGEVGDEEGKPTPQEEPPEVEPEEAPKQEGEEHYFTGTIMDKLGRRNCYVRGRRVPCSGGPPRVKSSPFLNGKSISTPVPREQDHNLYARDTNTGRIVPRPPSIEMQDHPPQGYGLPSHLSANEPSKEEAFENLSNWKVKCPTLNPVSPFKRKKEYEVVTGEEENQNDRNQRMVVEHNIGE